jgi:uncharacterized protein YceH (UPF0502 family)
LDEIRLDRTEQRVIGVLIEKAFTVPDAYPLTFNALVAGCSQKSNRDPVLDLPEHHVDGALKALFIRGWVERRSREGGRVMRWGHRVPEKLGLEGSGRPFWRSCFCAARRRWASSGHGPRG